MSRRFAQFAFLGVATLLASLSVACGSAAVGGEDPASQGVDVAVVPSQTAVTSLGSTQFAAAVTGTSVLSVKWVVDESGGGTVDSSGLYVAPATAGTFHVRAVSVADSSVSAAAQVTVTTSGGSSSGGSSSGGSSSGGSSSGGSTTASCANSALRTTGTIYYYCDCQSGATSGCIAGSDSNTGTSASAPRRSFSDAMSRFNSMKAGDTIAFCRGGSFASATGTFRNPSCTASSTCDFRDYAPSGMSSAPRPIFNPGSGTFAALSGSGIQKQGYRFWNLDVRHSGGGYSFNIGDSSTDIDVCNVAMSGGSIGVLEQTTNQRLTIRNCQISKFAGDGFLGGSNDLLLDSNVFTDNGIFTDNRSHSIYLQGGIEQSPSGYNNERIVNNDIIATSAGTCVGTVFTASGRNNDLVVENNRITVANSTAGCYPLEVGTGYYPYSTWHYRAIIRRNRITVPRSNEGIGVSVCVNCVISDNSIALTDPAAGYDAIIVGEVQARTSQYPDEPVSSGNIIQNNSIYLPYYDQGSTGAAVWIKEGSGHVLENNAAWVAGSNTSCWSIKGSTARNSNNYCRGSGGPAATALWTSPSTGVLTLASGSPLIGYGSSTNYSAKALSPSWSASDTGVTRTAPIDAGAYIH